MTRRDQVSLCETLVWKAFSSEQMEVGATLDVNQSVSRIILVMVHR